MAETLPELWVPASVDRARVQRKIRDGGIAYHEADGHRYAIMDAEDPLFKSMASARAQGQPYRVSTMLHSMGAYQGIREPRTATMKTMAILREIPKRNPVIAAILRRRQNQVAAYTRLPRWKGDTGFRIRTRDPEQRATPAITKELKRIQDIVVRGGVRTKNPETGEPGCWDAELAHKAMSFQQINRAFVWDSMVLDAAAIRFEVGKDQKKFPVVFMAPVDAALVRFATPKNEGKDALNRTSAWSNMPYDAAIRKEEKHVRYVMMDEAGMSVNREFKWDELSYLVRNPRSDTWTYGYGYAELEMLVDCISGLLFGIKYNTEFFDSNHVPVGLLSLIGDYTDDALEDLRKQFKMMVGGATQFWTMPIITSKEGSPASYIPMRQDTEGMKWQGFIQFCTSVACALYGMDATEIGMTNFGASTNALANQNNEAKVQSLTEYGLVPLLACIEQFWTEAVVEKFNDEFCLGFEGLSTESSDEKRAESGFRFSMGLLTPNMWNAHNDEKPIYDPKDRHLLRQIDEYVRKQVDDTATEDEILRTINRAYELQGGEWCEWPDAPVGSPSALAIWQTEHGIGEQDTGMPPGMEGGDDGQDGEEQGEEQPPGHQYAFGDQDGKVPEQPMGGTHTGQPGQFMPAAEKERRATQNGNGEGAIRKSLFDVIIRRRGGPAPR